MLADPISKEVLEEPYLASDGETYSRTTLLAAMAADPLHRSPVTGEVLRPLAYRNIPVEEFLGGSGRPRDLVLYQVRDHALTLAQSHRALVFLLPEVLPADDIILRRKWGLPDMALEVRAAYRRDQAGNKWLLYPPCVQEARADTLQLLVMVGGGGVFANPWCFTGADIRWRTGSVTVEDAWRIKHGLGKHRL